MIDKYLITGTGAINDSHRVARGKWQVKMITLALSAAATTGTQDYELTVDSEDGAAYDVVLRSVEMVADGGLYNVYTPVESLLLDGGKPNSSRLGDQLKVTFPNTDGLTVGIVVWLEKVR